MVVPSMNIPPGCGSWPIAPALFMFLQASFHLYFLPLTKISMTCLVLLSLRSPFLRVGSSSQQRQCRYIIFHSSEDTFFRIPSSPNISIQVEALVIYKYQQASSCGGWLKKIASITKRWGYFNVAESSYMNSGRSSSLSMVVFTVSIL